MLSAVKVGMVRVPANTAAFTAAVAAFVLLMLVMMAGCSSQVRVDDPLASVADPGRMPFEHKAAIEELAERGDEPAVKALHRMIWVRGYVPDVREAALEALELTDPEGLQRTIRQQLPRMQSMAWLTRLCEIVADRGWKQQTPALISSWARPINFSTEPETERPEYKALVRMHGRERVVDEIFTLFTEANKPSEQGLRTRCWTLLHRLGHRDRLVELLQSSDVPSDDLMLQDLRRMATELGIVPVNREEILWVRKLQQPEYETFWSQAVEAAAQLPEGMRRTLEPRDLPVIVAALLHEPQVLEMSQDALYDQVNAKLQGRQHIARSTIETSGSPMDDRLYQHRRRLKWGDLAAIRIALSAMDVPQVRAHLFDYARRDHEDRTTEYGGVIQLDSKGRFEVLEFLPRIRQHDLRFNASQEMFDAAYPAQFHFHFHAQSQDNDDYAGPGFGDLAYAENTRANCLVLTFINKTQMNVDYYRHGRVVIDLGVIGDPAGSGLER